MVRRDTRSANEVRSLEASFQLVEQQLHEAEAETSTWVPRGTLEPVRRKKTKTVSPDRVGRRKLKGSVIPAGGGLQ